jgi:hypothetical protein
MLGFRQNAALQRANTNTKQRASDANAPGKALAALTDIVTLTTYASDDGAPGCRRRRW